MVCRVNSCGAEGRRDLPDPRKCIPLPPLVRTSGPIIGESAYVSDEYVVGHDNGEVGSFLN